VMLFVTAGILLSIIDMLTGSYSDPSKSLVLKLASIVSVGALE
jgi:hypothetical protein